MKSSRRFFVLSAALLPLSAQRSDSGSAKKGYIVYVGTFTGDESTGQGSKGIYAFRFPPATGQLTSVGLVAETDSPAFLAMDPKHRFLYTANEVSNYEGKPAGSVTSYAINSKTGALTLINRVTTRGTRPAHLVVDKTNKCVIVANFGSGSVAAYLIRKDGGLDEAAAFVQHTGSSITPRQKGPHAHMIALSADNRFALVPDLGLDRVVVYRVDPEKAALTPHDPPFASVKPGLGPRHLAFHPNGRFAYLLSEMGSNVTVFGYDGEAGKLTELQNISTLPSDFTILNNSAEIEVHKNGRFVYASNRGHDSIVVFAIDPNKGTLTTVERVSTQGKTPRNFAIDPTGTFLFAANQDSGSIVLFRIDPQTGRLTPTGETVNTPSPVCVLFIAAG